LSLRPGLTVGIIVPRSKDRGGFFSQGFFEEGKGELDSLGDGGDNGGRGEGRGESVQYDARVRNNRSLEKRDLALHQPGASRAKL
jgi:hypothetical protein